MLGNWLKHKLKKCSIEFYKTNKSFPDHLNKHSQTSTEHRLPCEMKWPCDIETHCSPQFILNRRNTKQNNMIIIIIKHWNESIIRTRMTFIIKTY